MNTQTQIYHQLLRYNEYTNTHVIKTTNNIIIINHQSIMNTQTQNIGKKKKKK